MPKDEPHRDLNHVSGRQNLGRETGCHGISLRRRGKTSIDDPSDFRTAGAAIGPGIRYCTDSLDAVTSIADSGDDAVDADRKAGADGGAWVRLIRARTTGNNEEALAQIGMDGGELSSCPTAGHGDRLAGKEECGKQRPPSKFERSPNSFALSPPRRMSCPWHPILATGNRKACRLFFAGMRIFVMTINLGVQEPIRLRGS